MAAPSISGGGKRRQFAPGVALLASMLGALAVTLTLWEARAVTPVDTEAEARRYASLALTLGQLNEGEVESWLGTDPLAVPRRLSASERPQFASAVASLAEKLALPGQRDDEQRRARLRILVRRLADVTALLTEPPTERFFQEASTIYGMAAPTDAEVTRWRRARAELDALLPGTGPLAARLEAFRSRFIVPVDRREALFERALAECRARTLAQWKLPPGERLDVVWTDSVPAAWHRYEGNFHSVLQVNRLALALPGQAIDLACHEGYPGHHAQSVLAHAVAGPAGPPVEERLMLLRSPDSIVREGAADVGVELAFPPEDRLVFLREVLFPLAGFDPAEAARYARIEALERRASGGSLPILARYRDGTLGRDRAAEALASEALIASPGALLDFTDRFGAYVTGYTVARDRIRAALASNCGDLWTGLRAFAEQPRAAQLYLQAAKSASISS